MNKKLISILFCLLTFWNALITGEIRAVAFDFDGVVANVRTGKLIDFLVLTFDINRQEVKKLLQKNQEALDKNVDENKFWADYAKSKKKVLSKNWMGEYHSIVEKSITEISGTIEIVKNLKSMGYKTALLSNAAKSQALLIRKLGYLSHFEPALFSFDIQANKPAPKVYRILLDTLDLKANEVLFIDDKLINVQGARDQGIDSIMFQNPLQLAHELRARGLMIP